MAMADWQQMLVRPDWPLKRAVETLNAAPIKICLVADAGGRLVGTVTDGDVRRAILAGTSFEAPIERIMNARPLARRAGLSTAELFALYSRCRQQHIRQLPQLDAEGRITGIETLDGTAIADDRKPGWVMLMAGLRSSAIAVPSRVSMPVMRPSASSCGNWRMCC